ncbi:MAG: hypothetical protein RSF02_01300 [Bacilli bacterium]
MRKNRNSFFNEPNMGYNGYDPNMNNMMPPNQPYPNTNNYNPYPQPMPNNNIQFNNSSNDLESRLSKIERQLNRLDHRISKLEQNSTFISEEYDSTTNNNMYML